MNNSETSTRTDLIRSNTPENVNRKIDAKTEHIIHNAEANGLRAVRNRLKKLDKEWDIEKASKVGISALMLIELIAARKKKKWIMAQLVQLPMFLMGSRLGRYSPSILLRFLGFRTRAEINKERNELLRFLDKSFPYDINQNKSLN